MKKITLKSLISILMISNYLTAQQEDLWTNFTTANGLIHNQIETICESMDGALWFGTYKGISRYRDGIWTNITTSNGLHHNKVKAIYESVDGAIWIGTLGGGVSRYQNGTWTTFTKSSGLIHDEVYAICESNDGIMWFGTKRGVSRYQNGTWKSDTLDADIAGNYVVEIFKSSDGTLWFGTAGGTVKFYKDFTWNTFPLTLPSNINNLGVFSIYESRDSAMWFGIYGGGVAQYLNDSLTVFTKDSGLAEDYVYSICQSENGAMWFGTWGGGVSCYQNGTWKTITTNEGLIHNDVSEIYKSSDGVLWFGTTGGVSRYEEAIWITFTQENGLAANPVYTICELSDNTFLFGTWGGVSRYIDGNWLPPITTANGLAVNQVTEIFESSDGALWFGYGPWERGVTRYHNGVWKTFTTEDGLANNDVKAMYESKDSILWFGTWGGVSRFHEGKWFQPLTKNDGLADNHITVIFESGDGALWFGTWGGISRYESGYWRTFTSVDGLAYNEVEAICESKDESLWFGTHGGGVSRYQNGKWTTYSTSDGLSDYRINTAFCSSDGALWFGTDLGVSRYKNDEWITYNTTNGLANNNIQDIFESIDGYLWFGTLGGANRLKPDRTPPFTYTVEGPDDNDLIGISTPMFICSGKDYRTKIDELKYSYVVFDSNGIVITGDPFDFHEKTAIQTIIPNNGKYIFCVSARDNWGNIDPTPATRTFTVDLTQPTVIINSPKQEHHIKGKFAILGYAFDNSPIKDFDYYKLYYSTYISVTQEPDWKQDKFSNLKINEVRNDTLGIFDMIGLEDGLYQIKLWAIDTLKHESEDKVLIIIDNTKPIVEISSPKTDDKVGKKVDIYATINDVNIEKYSLEYKIVHQAKWQYLNQDTLSLSIENQLIYTWENSSDSGDVYLKLTAWDKAGNSTSDTVLFVLDNKESQLPTANILYPSDNTYLHDYVRIIGYATDKNFTKYVISLKGENIDTLLIESDKKKENDVLFTLDTKSFPDDKYTIDLTVLNDRQYQKTDSISITIDNTLPFAQITSPLSDTISCYTLIQGEAYDENLKGITLKYAKVEETDSSKFMLINTAFAYWNTMDLNGYYTLYLTVEDKGGLKAIDKKTYYIDNPIFNQRNGLWKSQGEFSLYIPPNGYPASVICLEKRSIDDFIFDQEAIIPTELICEINSSIEETQFSKPAVFTLDYKNIDLSQFDESKFRVFSWENDSWKLVGGTLDEDKKIITTSINRIGVYGLLESKKAIENGDKRLQVNCQPRLFSPRGGGHSAVTNISFHLGKDSNVTVKIFNMAGRFVNTLCENTFMTSGMNSIAWDGEDSSGSYCISGLYVVFIQAEEENATKTVMVLNK